MHAKDINARHGGSREGGVRLPIRMKSQEAINHVQSRLDQSGLLQLEGAQLLPPGQLLCALQLLGQPPTGLRVPLQLPAFLELRPHLQRASVSYPGPLKRLLWALLEKVEQLLGQPPTGLRVPLQLPAFLELRPHLQRASVSYPGPLKRLLWALLEKVERIYPPLSPTPRILRFPHAQPTTNLQSEPKLTALTAHGSPLALTIRLDPLGVRKRQQNLARPNPPGQ
jgi:hypothetical protein